MSPPLELTGKVFGRLTVIRRDYSRKSTETWWLCKCTCGRETVARGASINT